MIQSLAVVLASEVAMPALVLTDTISINKKLSCATTSKPLNLKLIGVLEAVTSPVTSRNSRGKLFSEEAMSWQIPMGLEQRLVNLAVSPHTGVVSAVTTKPAMLYTHAINRETVTVTRLESLFPRYRQPTELKVMHLPASQTSSVCVFEPTGGSVFVLDPTSSAVKQVDGFGRQSILGQVASGLLNGGLLSGSERNHIVAKYSEQGWVVVWEATNCLLQVLDFRSNTQHTVSLSFPEDRTISSVELVTPTQWFVSIKDTKSGTVSPHMVSFSSENWAVSKPVLSLLTGTNGLHPLVFSTSAAVASVQGLPRGHAPAHVLIDHHNFAHFVCGFDKLSLTGKSAVYSGPCTMNTQVEDSGTAKTTRASGMQHGVSVQSGAHIITALPASSSGVAGYLDVFNISRNTAKRLSVREIPDYVGKQTQNFFGYGGIVGLGLLPGSEGIVSAESTGTFRLWDIEQSVIQRNLNRWKEMVGTELENSLRVEYTRFSGKDVTAPKHGKEDPKNEPHVGGNTWAGGTGGRDTAGLGGKGGPYRLDKGHDVHQV